MTVILIIAGLFVAFIGFGFLVGPQVGILLAFLGKPIIDATWNFSIGNINLLKIVGVLLPVMVFAHCMTSRSRTRSQRTPLLSIWLIYAAYTCLSYGFQLAYTDDVLGEVVNVVQLAFRTLNGLAAYLMVQAYFREPDQFRRLLVFLILASLFPMLTGIYQAATGVVWQERSTVGLARNVGLYHDAFTFRGYAFQTLTAVVLYWAYFVKRTDVIKRLLLAGISVMALLVLYKVYSKAGVLILLLWILIWAAGRRSLAPAIGIVIILLAVNAVTSELLFSEVEQLYSKELVVSDGRASNFAQKQTLGGRWFIWSHFLGEYWDSSLIEQMFGTGRAVPAHNDFLVKMISSGILGTVLYALLLWVVGVKLVRNYFRERSPLNVMGLMVFVMWMVDTIGLSPSIYTSYQWYAWGIMGLAIRGLDPVETEPEPKPKPKPNTVVPGRNPTMAQRRVPFSRP